MSDLALVASPVQPEHAHAPELTEVTIEGERETDTPPVDDGFCRG